MNRFVTSCWRVGVLALSLLAAAGCESSPSPTPATTTDAAGDSALETDGTAQDGKVAETGASETLGNDSTASDSADTAACGNLPTEMCGSCDNDVELQKQCLKGAWVCPAGTVPALTKQCNHVCAGVPAPSCCTAAGTTIDATCTGPSPSSWSCPDGKAPLSKGQACGADVTP